MKKKQLEYKVQKLEEELAELKVEYQKLERDRLTIYNLLYKVNKELDDALANKQTFISSMSHELRSPLAAVLGNASLIAQTDLSSDQERYLGQLKESAEFLMSLLSDLLDVSKLKESKVELNIQEIHLDKLLLNCANMVEPRIKEGVELITNIPSLPYYAFADKKRLQQIFINILTNAAKFTTEGTIGFYIVEINQIDKQLEVIVEVTDTGPGIPAEIKETLFEPFASTDKEEGTGLGLYISYELAALMGGEIVVESEEGVGTTFRVTFMCEKSGLKMRNLATNSFVSKDKIKRDYSHLKVLIVEDIEVNREFLKEMFKVFFSLEIDLAENGAVGVEKAELNDYDIIFMDMQMPIMGGLEASREIRKFNQDVSIVCMSANVYREDKHNAFEAGMNDFIEKPLEHTDIESRLAKIAPDAKTIDSSNTQKNNESQKSFNPLQEQAMKHFQEHFNEETSRNFIEMAIKGLKTNLENLDKNFAEQNLEGLKEDFHAIKGIFSNLGLMPLSYKAGELQDFAQLQDFENIEKRIELFITKTKEFFI
jgi:nitrogen-specific signal transduction histidine kinase/DNA-binding NarL/FixJ family response regulator